MKSIKRIFVGLLMLAGISTAANAQLSIGPRVGVNVNSLHFNDLGENFSSENRAGFVGGLQLEVMIPVTNIGVDASVLYVHRSNSLVPEAKADVETEVKKDYIEVPINLKWKIGLPVIGQYVSPYLATGPSFAFLTGKENINAAWEQKKVDVAWNFGVGVQLFKKLQVGASYGLGLSKAIKTVDKSSPVQPDIKNRCWTITAAYMFSL